jgi:4,5-dihydroxyphthalate decarboxylase
MGVGSKIAMFNITKPKLKLTLGLSKKPPNMPLIKGIVKPEGIDLTCITEFPEPSALLRHKRIVEGELDGGEMSSSSFLSDSEKRGNLLAIPVFPFRAFRHDSVYCHDEAGINKPEDLRGKKVALHRYNASTMTWVRGILRNEYGIRPEELSWYTAGEEVFEVGKPEGVSIQIIPPPVDRKHLIAMVATGELDAAIEPNNITQEGIIRLFPNYVEVEKEYYRKTGIYPMIHTMCIQKRIIKEYPWVAKSLYSAYLEAVEKAPQFLMEHEEMILYEKNKTVLSGENPFTCGLGKREKRTLEVFMDYLIADGALAKKLALSTLFAVKDIDG